MVDIEFIRILAIELHSGQHYGDYPYSYHLDEVAEEYMRTYGMEDQCLAICYLHDVLEDVEISVEALEELAELEEWQVLSLKFLNKNEFETKEEYIQNFIKEPIGDPTQESLIEEVALTVARQVKICDTVCNLRNSIIVNDDYKVSKYTKQLAKLLHSD